MLAPLGHEPYLENSGSSIKQGPKSNQHAGDYQSLIVHGGLFPALKKIHWLDPMLLR
jgi:hypothetical protein